MLSNFNQLKMVIVDFDNTLFDTNKANFISYKNTFKKYGTKFDIAMFRNYSGLNKKEFYQKVLGKKAINITNDIYEKKKLYYIKNLKFVKLNHQLISILHILKKNKIKICLVSNASKDSVSIVLRKFRLDKFFNSIITSTDMLNCKSNGVAFKKLMKKFGTNKKNTIVIDDNNLGIEASKKNNLQALIVKNFN